MSLWDGDRKLRSQKALLAGEAASLIDPLSGEGIEPAIFRCFKIAEAIDRAVGGAGDAKKQYTQTIAQESATDMVWAERLAGAFSQFTRAAYRVGVKLPIATESISKILCDELRYADLANRALKKLMPF
jgi:flavin-dependent dehydrogenase